MKSSSPDDSSHQTGQESRSAGHRAAASVTAVDSTTYETFLPHDDGGLRIMDGILGDAQ
jgi:hypothetical protein